jgi:hypothetical protein
MNMPRAKLKNQEPNGITVVKNMRDYSNDPFVLKKAEKAKAAIKKYGLPKSFTKKNK